MATQLIKSVQQDPETINDAASPVRIRSKIDDTAEGLCPIHDHENDTEIRKYLFDEAT